MGMSHARKSNTRGREWVEDPVMSNICFERFTTAWLSDPTIFSVNEQPVHSDHEFYASRKELDENWSSLVRSLDGKWKAHFAINPAGAPDALLTGSIMDGSLREINVPCEFQLINPEWDPPHYVNVQYPWDGHEALKAPEVSEEYNPTVTCVKTFHLSLKDLQNRIILHLGGVEAAVLSEVFGRDDLPWRENWPTMCRAILAGYESVTALSAEEKAAVPTLMQGNELLCIAAFAGSIKYKDVFEVNMRMLPYIIENRIA